MDQLQHITSSKLLKVIGDDRRQDILRLLMRKPMTLSQLGRVLDTYPAKVRHHLKLLEEAGLVELTSTQIVRGFVEKYYQATAQAYLVNMAIFPALESKQPLLLFGSHDLALELLSDQLLQVEPTVELFSLPVGSLDGLIALRQGVCQIAGCHLYDEKTDEYNLDYVRHLFPGESMTLFTLTFRQQGLLVGPNNPKNLRDISDLARDDVVFANRQSGSGTRLWLDRQLKKIGIPVTEVDGYGSEMNTHLQVGQAVMEGKADTGLGIFAAARRYGLDFIPLFEERYDLVMPSSRTNEPGLQPLLAYLSSAALQKGITELGGYDTSHTGDMMLADG